MNVTEHSDKRGNMLKKKEVYVQTDINILWGNKLSKNEFEILQTYS